MAGVKKSAGIVSVNRHKQINGEIVKPVLYGRPGGKNYMAGVVNGELVMKNGRVLPYGEI